MENKLEVRVWGTGVVDDGKPLTNQELERLVDEDIKAFSEWFCSGVDTSTSTLSTIEASIIKTYLWWKTHPDGEPRG